jgi:hypothetical protein
MLHSLLFLVTVELAKRHNITSSRTATAQAFTSAIEDHEDHSNQTRSFHARGNPSSITAKLSKNKPGTTPENCQGSEHHRLGTQSSARG